MVLRIVKSCSLPVLLAASMFSRFAANFEFLLNLAVCMAAVVAVQRAVSLKSYFWAGGFVAIAVVFSPLALALKIFLLLGLTAFTAVSTLFVTWQPQPLATV